MKGHERIETARLVLRRPTAADAEAIFSRYAGDPEVTRFLSWPTHLTTDETRGFLGVSDAEWQRWPAGPYLVECRQTGVLLGGTGLSFETRVRVMTGYVLAKDAWGFGFATETLGAMVALAHRLGVRRLYALCHPDHPASTHVLEKGGFAREGLLRRYAPFPNLPPADPGDVLCYARVFA
ncbi:MAG: GNAT family N-acetyltransferase [Acidobacteria bacterium]|jgi:RimJ/RimL family protein N-acetyltransferase|nr:GNAT family N-acetyltransferase [Acidobacteriota bacterium]